MCHGQLKSSKTVRWESKESHHKSATPYKRADKHKSKWTDDMRHF